MSREEWVKKATIILTESNWIGDQLPALLNLLEDFVKPLEEDNRHLIRQINHIAEGLISAWDTTKDCRERYL